MPPASVCNCPRLSWKLLVIAPVTSTPKSNFFVYCLTSDAPPVKTRPRVRMPSSPLTVLPAKSTPPFSRTFDLSLTDFWSMPLT